MREALAERLLAEVMEWTPEDIARERPLLQVIATYKYDEYQQFSPGMRFTESFALWLSQFSNIRERIIAYEFIMRKLIFCSSAEINHLVNIAYPDYIRPVLLRNTALALGYNPRHVAKVANTIEFKLRQRQCLFLGLSDGARTDAFRRCNRSNISHEQVWQTYEISDQRANDLISSLTTSVQILTGNTNSERHKFRTIILLDDFSASGISYLRRESEGFKGKIAKFYHNITNNSSVSNLIELKDAEIMVVLYMSTEQAYNHLENLMRELCKSHNIRSSIIIVYPIHSNICIQSGTNPKIDELLEAYYDEAIEDEHTRKGGTDLRYGFAGCGLPLVLNHNTPNNSLSILWARTGRVRPLFPRVSRH